MKKITVFLMTVCLSLAFIPTQVKASPAASSATMALTTTTESAEANVLLARLGEIKAMDKTNLTSVQKRGLRTELRSIRYQLTHLDGGGIYISAGVLILIIVLLIILL